MMLDEIKAAKKYALNGGPFGSKLVTNDYIPEGVPVIRGTNLSKDTYFSFEDLVFVSEEKADELKPNNAHPGDIIFTQRGTLGQVGIIPKICKYKRFVISQSQMKLTVDEIKTDSYFIYYYFRNPNTIQRIKNLAFSSGVPHINLQVLREFEIELPPLPTQRKIAAILSAYDDLIENNTRRIKILEEMAQALYREWFVNFRFPGHEKVQMEESELGPKPEGWEVVKFTDIADVLSGGTPKTNISEYWNGQIPFFAPKDSPSSFYVLETEKSITELGLKRCNSKLYPRNTVFITARGTVGKIAMPAVNMAMNQSCYALKGRDGISQYFVFLAIKNCIEELKQRATGAVFDTIIVDTFRMLEVVKPPISLINRISDLVTPLFDLILNISYQNANLRRTRDLLLPQLISGKIDIENVKINDLS